jgi:hypothetical protein
VTQLMSVVCVSTYFGCNETLGILMTTFAGTSSTKPEAACCVQPANVPKLWVVSSFKEMCMDVKDP